MTGINDLPIELYLLIFRDNLSITDLFNCRLVNKKFKFATYESVRKLAIGDLDEFKNNFWFHNNELIDNDHVISLNFFKKIRSIFNLDHYLKYLRIDFNQFTKYNFDEFDEEFTNLNNLINLECLELNYISCDFKLDLNLKNLKYLKLIIKNGIRYGSATGTYELNTPKLKKIRFDYEMPFKPEILFKSNPESIKHLIITNYDDELKQFKNLEIIEFDNVSNLDVKLLSFFNNLKQVKIENFKFHELIQLSELLDKREELNRDIDIYLFGVKIINKDQLKKFETCEDILKYQFYDYDLLHLNAEKSTCLDYSRLNNFHHNLKNDLPSLFFDKYQNISHVEVYRNRDDKRIDTGDLNRFLNNLKCLKRIGIDSVLLDQNFFNNLPITIRQLSISSFDKKLYSNINFDFILKFTKLIEFYQYGWDIDLFDLTLSSFSNLKYLGRFQFIYKCKEILIMREKKFLFSLNFSKSSLDYDQLVKCCNQLRSKCRKRNFFSNFKKKLLPN